MNREGWDANVTDLNSWFGVTTAANGRVVMLELPTDPYAGEEVPRLVGEILIICHASMLGLY